MSDIFSSFHPLVNMLFFLFAILFTMFFTHPVCLFISFLCAFTYSVCLKGKKALRFNAVFILPMLLVTALLNPAFNHEGATILTYLPDGNPLTLESIAYGAAAALMLAAVVSWFSCFNEIMTTDKIVYLSGRAIPALSLILSMSLRLVPRFIEQIKTVSAAQKCIGRDPSSGSVFTRARRGLMIMSILVTWALENAIETADSMKGRGYGLPGRTAFSIFRFDKRDRAALIFFLITGAYIIAGSFAGGLYFRYFPTIASRGVSPYAISLFAAYASLCAAPVAIKIYNISLT